MMDLTLALVAGVDIPVPQCQLILHQPTIKEISYIGEQQFFLGLQCLTIKKQQVTQDESLLANMTNFQIFMTIMTDIKTGEKRQAVLQVFQLLFPSYKVSVLPRGIYMTCEGESKASIDEENFENLQEVLETVFCLRDGPMAQNAFNPADEQARKIAEKLMRGRQRVAAQKGEKESSIFSRYVSILTVGLGSMSLQQCLDLTMYQLFDLIERYSLYMDWDIDIRARLAGGSPESRPDNWMKNIH